MAQDGVEFSASKIDLDKPYLFCHDEMFAIFATRFRTILAKSFLMSKSIKLEFIND